MKQIKMTNDMREKAIQQFVEHMESIRYFDTDKINFIQIPRRKRKGASIQTSNIYNTNSLAKNTAISID